MSRIKLTIAELISELQKYDPRLPVVVNGYEGGYTYPALPIRLELTEDYWGNSDENNYGDGLFGQFDDAYDDSKSSFYAVVLSR